MERQPISVIVISYYKIHRLKECLGSILPLIIFGRDELCIVDNSIAEWDESLKESKEIREYLNELAKIYPIKLIVNQQNRKFSESVNQGIKSTTNPLIFLVNNDIKIVDMSTFDVLSTEIATRKKIATMTPVTIHSDGRVYCAGAFGMGAHYRDMPNNIRQSEWNNFAFVCIKRQVINEIGLLHCGKINVKGRGELNCKHFHSDEEWCRRATAAGYSHFVHPVIVHHYHQEDRAV